MKRILILLISTGLFAVSCQPSVQPQGAQANGPQAWVDAPLDGSTIPLASYQIVAHAAFPGGIEGFELTITSSEPQTIPAPAEQSGQTLVYINQMWTPPAPGTYLIQVRAAGPGGAYGPVAEAQVQVGAASNTSTPASAQQACLWTATVNVFVREGPGASNYPEITAVEAGTAFQVLGQSQDQQFWAVEVQPGQIGYVPKADSFGGVDGNCDVPVLADPPLPATEVPASLPQCGDGADNDGDGLTDFNPGVGDRECVNAEDNDEAVR